MSKRELKRYLGSLEKVQLEEQILELYSRLKEVKAFYDFVFNPREDKLLEESKLKISNEYFPISGRKAKARRSTAQKYIRNFLTLGVNPSVIADVMLYNIEIAQIYSSQGLRISDSFYKSMLNSFEQATTYIEQESLVRDFKERVTAILDEIDSQNWPNSTAFKHALRANFKIY